MTSRTPRDTLRVPGGVASWSLVGLVGLFALAAYIAIRLIRLGAGRAAPPAAHQHDGRVGHAEGEPLRLAVLGDSAAAGYRIDEVDHAYPRQVAKLLAEARGRPVELTSFATNGARMADLTADQVPVVPTDSDVVVVAAGVNDALGRRHPEQVAADTRELVDALRQRVPAARIVVVGCPDLSSAPGFPWPVNHFVGWSCRRVREAQRSACRDEPVRFVSYPGPPGREMYGVDGFHPGPLGQAAGARATVAALADPEDDGG